MMSDGPNVSRMGLQFDFFRLMMSSSVRAASSPASIKSGWMLVNVGVECSQMGVKLSTPHTAISRGMSNPDCAAAVKISAATLSLAAKIEHGFAMVSIHFLRDFCHEMLCNEPFPVKTAQSLPFSFSASTNPRSRSSLQNRGCG